MKNNLLIIDGHNFLFKAYGVPFKFHSEKGTPLHVATVFLSLLRRTIGIVDAHGGCTSVAIVFDCEEKSSNHLLSETYKANRRDYSKDEDSPFRHLPQILSALRYLKIKTYDRAGFEADDLIASLATQYGACHKRGHVFIASTDSDFYQLLSSAVSQIVLGKNGSHIILGPKEIKEKLGVRPAQYVRFKSLTGDTADNVKGVPGIGPVRAEKIVNKKIAFDIKPYTDLLVHNTKIITLNRDLLVCKDMKHIELRPRIRELKSNDIFERAGL